MWWRSLLSGRSTAALMKRPDNRARCIGANSDPLLTMGTCTASCLLQGLRSGSSAWGTIARAGDTCSLQKDETKKSGAMAHLELLHMLCQLRSDVDSLLQGPEIQCALCAPPPPVMLAHLCTVPSVLSIANKRALPGL